MNDDDTIELETSGHGSDILKRLIAEYNDTEATVGKPIEPENQRAWIMDRVDLDDLAREPEDRNNLVRAAIGRQQAQCCRSGVAFVNRVFSEGYFKPDLFDTRWLSQESFLMIKALDGKYVPIRHLVWKDWDDFVSGERARLEGKAATLNELERISELLKQALGHTKTLGQLADEMDSAA